MRICEVGRSWRSNDREGDSDRPVSYWSEALLSGCAGLGVPLLFAVLGDSREIQVVMGTYPGLHRRDDGQHGPGVTLAALEALVASHYPGSRAQPADGTQFQVRLREMMVSGNLGLVTGIASRSRRVEWGEMTQMDRLLHAMQGRSWGWVVMADPLPGQLSRKLGHAVVNEMRAVSDAEQVKPRPGPLAETYLRRLELLHQEFERGFAVGSWTVSAFFLAPDRTSFKTLGAALGAVLGGEQSLPEPVRVLEIAEPGPFRAALGPILLATAEAPGQLEYPYSFQTILNSQRLSALIHLPRLEAPGFAVREIQRFDVALPHDAAQGPIELGRVHDLGRRLEVDYRLSTGALSKHTLIVGVTGSGKTNTAFHLLRQLWSQEVPFLVLEPAKTEYRALIADPVVGSALRVFTLGEESVSPFRLNPFEVEPGASLATHIDLLKATFNASFVMWSPLPQVLERCLHDVYRDYGWDPVRGVNRRLPSDATPEARALAFPTLSALSAKIEEVVDSLGYEARVTSDIKAALVTRLESLCIGGKGAMLDTPRSIPLSELLLQPTVIELEQVGDDDEKAFLMGLLLIRIFEHLRASADNAGSQLRHVVVVEEAHRLLASVARGAGEEQANTRAKAVESFVNMLSEVRAYGQGFLIAEQIPSKLAPDALKNTNVKVVHRTVAREDRELLAGSMNMDQDRSRMLATFRPGEAAVFSEGDDRPVLVQVPYSKLESPAEAAAKAGRDAIVRRHMEPFRRNPAIAGLFVPFPDCAGACGTPYAFCEDAQAIVAQGEFREIFMALMLALTEDAGDVRPGLEQLQRYVRSHSRRQAPIDRALPCLIRHAICDYLRTFGRLYDWQLPDVERLSVLMTASLTALTAGGKDNPTRRQELWNLYRGITGREEDPFPQCGDICPGGDCRFRYQVATLLGDVALTELFDLGMGAALGPQGWGDLRALRRVETRLAGGLPADRVRSAALCYGCQQIAYKSGLLQVARTLAMETLLAGYEDVTEGPVGAFNAAAMGEDPASPQDSGGGSPDESMRATPSWQDFWEDTGQLPPDPRKPSGADLVPDWDPGPAYRKGRAYLDELSNGVPGGGGGGRDQSHQEPFKEFDAWKKKIDRIQARFEQTLEWNRSAIQRARVRALA